MTRIQEDNIGYTKPRTHKPRMTSEIRDLMTARRLKSIEVLKKKKHDSFNTHKVLIEFTGRLRKRTTAILRDQNNSIIVDIVNNLEYWKTYVETLFRDNRTSHITVNGDSGPGIMKEVVMYALSRFKSDEAICSN